MWGASVSSNYRDGFDDELVDPGLLETSSDPIKLQDLIFKKEYHEGYMEQQGNCGKLWRAEKVRYLLNMKAFAREGSQLKAQLVSLAKNFFRREYGKYWAESKKMIVKKDDILLNSLYEFAKVV